LNIKKNKPKIIVEFHQFETEVWEK